ncbi:hypothetical protein D3C76_1502450 [compost metagenome]
MAQPVTCFQRSAAASCRAMPPERVSFSAEKSSLRKSSLLHSATNRVFRPTKPVNLYFASSLVMDGRSRGLEMRMLWLPVSIIAMQWKVKA